MADYFERLSFSPTTLMLARGRKAAIWKTFALICVMLWIGLLPGVPPDWWDIIRSERGWFIFTLIIDLWLFLPLRIASRRDWRLAHFLRTSRMYSAAELICNLMPGLTIVFILLTSLYNLVHFRLWHEFVAIASLVFLQGIYLKGSRYFARNRRGQGESRKTRWRLTAKLFEGAVGALGFYAWGFTIFLILHLMALSFLSARHIYAIEVTASEISNRLEHPFGTGHPGIQIWIIFAATFAVAAFMGSARLDDMAKASRKIESLCEAVLVGFLWFSLIASRSEGLGIQAESGALRRAEERLYIAEELKPDIAPLADQEKVNVRSVMLRIDDSSDDGERVGEEVISQIEAGQYDDMADDANQRHEVNISTMIRSLFFVPAAKECRLVQLRNRTVLVETRAEAATNALQELLDKTSDTAFTAVFSGDEKAAKLLVSALTDFISEAGDRPLKNICGRIVRVFSGREQFSGGPSSLTTIIDAAGKKVHDEEKPPDIEDRYIDRESHPAVE